jgi:hypothetical protein
MSRFSNLRCLKVTAVTILPKSRCIWKLQEVFPCACNYIIRRAKLLVTDQGIMSLPNSIGNILNEVTVEVVKSSYNNDDVSRVIPG